VRRALLMKQVVAGVSGKSQLREPGRHRPLRTASCICSMVCVALNQGSATGTRGVAGATRTNKIIAKQLCKCWNYLNQFLRSAAKSDSRRRPSVSAGEERRVASGCRMEPEIGGRKCDTDSVREWATSRRNGRAGTRRIPIVPSNPLSVIRSCRSLWPLQLLLVLCRARIVPIDCGGACRSDCPRLGRIGDATLRARLRGDA
jgi:hypothetical protein